ncbi:MAG: hypothetical protein CMH12_24315 [Maritimibacter sp.]|nr:hypothetical protein [Maritimibacter sp.]
MNVDGISQRGGAQGLPVLRATEFVVSNGANLGDPVAHASELILDDLYTLDPDARRLRLTLEIADQSSNFTIAAGTQVGRPGAALHLDCCATFMAPDGSIVEALILVELDRDDMIAGTFVMQLADLRPRTEYALVAVDTETARQKFAALACVSFTRGTRITMADGAQRPIEDIRPGDSVLTRDSGAQTVRWVGQQTVRASGAFAPITIAPGALNNEGPLKLSPNQRLFVYQREDTLGAGRSEVAIKAEYLVNGETVTRGNGGFVEYFQILFDAHEFIFAEGIATESLALDTRTGPALPREIRAKLTAAEAGRPRRAPLARPRPVDLPEGMLDSAIAADVLRKASAH